MKFKPGDRIEVVTGYLRESWKKAPRVQGEIVRRYKSDRKAYWIRLDHPLAGEPPEPNGLYSAAESCLARVETKAVEASKVLEQVKEVEKA